jgi:integrase
MPQVKPTTFEVHESTPYRGKKWRVSGYSGGKRKQYWHATKSAAQAHARDLNLERAAYGSDLVLTPALRLEVVQATQLLAPHGKSLLDGIRFYVDHLTASAMPTVPLSLLAARVREEFAQRRAENRLTPRSVDAVCVTLKKLEARFGDVSDIRSITTLQIREWLGTLDVAIKTRNQIRGYTRQIFGLAVQWELLEKNPVTPIEKMNERYNTEGVVGSLNAGDTERLFYAADPDVIPFMALWFFGGIRKETIEKLDWANVNLKERHAIVPRTAGKNKRRYKVTLSDNLVAWLQPHERVEGSLMAPSPNRSQTLMPNLSGGCCNR